MNGNFYPYGSNHLLSEEMSSQKLPNKVDVVEVPNISALSRATTLIQLSGGIDSTFVLWWWLVNHPDEFCVVHHIDMIHFENRSKKESEAVGNILKWLDSRGLKNYFYIQNTFDYGNIPGVVFDVEVCGFTAGVILATRRCQSINKVFFPIYGNETEREKIRREVMMLTAKREIECIYPLVGLEKFDVMKMIPFELLQLCWYCRSPLNGNPCGNCHTCKQVDDCFRDVVEENLKDFLKGF